MDQTNKLLEEVNKYISFTKENIEVKINDVILDGVNKYDLPKNYSNYPDKVKEYIFIYLCLKRVMIAFQKELNVENRIKIVMAMSLMVVGIINFYRDKYKIAAPEDIAEKIFEYNNSDAYFSV